MKVLSTFLILAAAATVSAYNNVTVKNLRLFDGNTEYFIKSICYSPAPIGYSYGDFKGASGVCAARTQYQLSADSKELNQISACYYEDFFDGSVDPNGQGNQQGWFQALWTRDLPVIAATGANVVRFYHTNPITKDLVFSDDGYKNKGYGSEYKPFMDAVASHNMKVVFPLFAELTQILGFPQAKMEEYIRSLVDDVGNHPALLMWQFGNELPLSDPSLGPQIIPKLNHFFDYARSYTYKRWARHVPISIALVDLPSWYNTLSRDLKVDIITTNSGYRGPTYSDLWFGAPNQGFDGLHSLSCETGKPVFVGEIGQHSTDGYYNSNTWFEDNWNALLENYKNGAVGGALFEYSDEAWKAENQRSMGIVHIQSDSSVTLKTAGGAYDYNAVKRAFARDIYTEMNRAPFTLDNVDNSACAAFPQFTPKQTPLYAFIDVTANTNPPSTFTSPPAATGNSGNNGGGSNGVNCGSGLSACGSACYKPAEYCCNQNALFPAGNAQCTATPTPTTSDVTPTPTSANNGGQTPSNSNVGTGNGSGSSNTGGATVSTGVNGNTGNGQAPATTSAQEVGVSAVERPQNSAAQMFAAALSVVALLAVV